MRTNIVIEDALMKEAMTLSGIKTKKETVEAGLKLAKEYLSNHSLAETAQIRRKPSARNQ